MDDQMLFKKLKILMDYGLTQDQAVKALAGASYFEEMGGTSVDSYWEDTSNFNIRDEFYLISNVHFLLGNIAQKVDAQDWLLKFQVAYLYQLKQNAQNIKSIDVLSSLNCYADAFAVCRTLQSRINFLLLCGFSPELFDHWLKNPKDPRYLDGHVRNELESHGVFTMEHIYELSSEIIHGQYYGHADIGYLTKGLFPEIPAIRNQIFVIAKFFLAASSYSLIQATLIGPKKKTKIDDIKEIDDLFKFFFKSMLLPSRLDHLWTIIAEDRHWKKKGKNKYEVGGAFGFHQYRDQLLKFHNPKKQKKRLSKRYRL